MSTKTKNITLNLFLSMYFTSYICDDEIYYITNIKFVCFIYLVTVSYKKIVMNLCWKEKKLL